VSDYVEESAITKESVEAMFQGAFFPITRDKDDDLVIRDEGVNTFIRVESERKMITFFTLWGLKDKVKEIDKLRFINTLNDKLILARFSMPQSGVLWCDYQFYYEGGIRPFQIVNHYKRFVSVCKSAAMRDTDDIIA
jgi:hypothetical protein